MSEQIGDFASPAMQPYLGTAGPAILGGLQNILPTGHVGGPPTVVGNLTPEPDPPPATDQELLEAVLVSTHAIERTMMRMPGYHKDPFIKGKTYKVLDDMKTHTAYNSPLRLKKYAVLYKEWDTLPRVNGKVVKDIDPRYDRANEIAEFCRYALNNIYDPDGKCGQPSKRQDFREVLWFLLDACHTGNATLEVVWRYEKTGKYKGRRMFAGFIPRTPSQITYNAHPYTNRVVSLNNYTALGWQNFMPIYRKFIQYVYQPDETPFGDGDARAAYKNVFSLNELTRLWGVAMQKHGAGFLKSKVDNPQKAFVDSVVARLEAAMSCSVIVDTPGTDTELLQMTGGTLDAFVHPIKYHEDSITKNILGQILTTSSGDGQGSYALGGIHQSTEEFFRSHPRRDLEELVKNVLYYWLVMTNYGEVDLDCLPSHSQGVWNWQELGLIAKFIETYTGLGYLRPDFDDEWARKLAGIPLLPTTAEIPTDNPYILPDKERVMIQVGGDQYKGTLVKPDGTTSGAD